MMRFAGMLLTEDESRELIGEVNDWCRRTGTNYNRLVTAAKVAVSTRSAVRHRSRRVTMMVAARLRAAMRDNPHGITREAHKARLRRPALAQAVVTYLQPVDRTPCSRCGIRADVGCRHSANWSAMEMRGMVRV